LFLWDHYPFRFSLFHVSRTKTVDRAERPSQRTHRGSRTYRFSLATAIDPRFLYLSRIVFSVTRTATATARDLDGEGGLIAYGQDLDQQSKSSLERSVQVLEQAKEVAVKTAVKLDEQTDRIGGIRALPFFVMFSAPCLTCAFVFCSPPRICFRHFAQPRQYRRRTDTFQDYSIKDGASGTI
jgi:hypothetical protein